MMPIYKISFNNISFSHPFNQSLLMSTSIMGCFDWAPKTKSAKKKEMFFGSSAAPYQVSSHGISGQFPSATYCDIKIELNEPLSATSVQSRETCRFQVPLTMIKSDQRRLLSNAAPAGKKA
jgi:hypothetical protein